MGRVPQVRQSVPGLKKTGEAHNSFHSVASKSRAGARKSIRNISFSAQVRFGEPGFPVTQHQTGPRVRLSVRKAAWSPSTPPNSIGNPGNLGHPSCSYWVLLRHRLLRDRIVGGVLTQTLKPVIFSVVYGPTKSCPDTRHEVFRRLFRRAALVR